MKKLKLLMATLLISCSSFSQGLTPTVHQLDGDTSFCFTITQSKQIAKKIVSNNYCDSVTIVQDEKIGLLNALTENKDSTITNLKWKIVNLNTMQKNNKTSIGHYEKTIATQKKLLKRSQFHKMLLSVGLGVVTVIAIAK